MYHGGFVYRHVLRRVDVLRSLRVLNGNLVQVEHPHQDIRFVCFALVKELLSDDVGEHKCSLFGLLGLRKSDHVAEHTEDRRVAGGDRYTLVDVVLLLLDQLHHRPDVEVQD